MENEEEIKCQILSAYNNLRKQDLYVRTNIVEWTELFSDFDTLGHRFYIKDESVQESGSFKYRGIINQIRNMSTNIGVSNLKLITFSSGNYGKLFASMCSRMGIDGLVIMLDSAPLERIAMVESFGVRTERHSAETCQSTIESYIKKENRIFFHPFDDINLIYGHASFGLEILEDLPDVDVALMGCGGGGLVSGTALALKLFGNPNCIVYGIEPEKANTMEICFETGAPYFKKDAKSVASGLSSPYSGKITYELCRKYVDDIFLVTEDDILTAMVKLHSWGIKAEPSGAAALAAVMFKKIPILLESKIPLNILIAVTGGNCSLWDFEYVNSKTNA